MRNGSMRLNARKLFLKYNSRGYILTRCFSSVPRLMNNKYPPRLIKAYLANSCFSVVGYNSQRTLHGGLNPSLKCCLLRLYSSESDGKSGEESKESTSDQKQDEKEATFETRKLSALSSRGERFKNEFLKRIVPWDKLPEISLDAFPYYIPENTKTTLVECAASHLKGTKVRKYGGRLVSSSNKIMLKSIPGTELYRERLVSAVAREFQVPLLKIDSNSFPPYEFGQDDNTQDRSESDSLSKSEYKTYSILEEEEEKDDDEEDEDEDKDDTYIGSLKKGDRVKYVGPTTCIKELNNRKLTKGQRGELSEVKGNKMGVVFHINSLATKEAEKDEKNKDTSTKAFIIWLDAEHIERDNEAHTHDSYIATEVLGQVSETQQPIIVYFSNSLSMLSWKCSYRTRKSFDVKLQKMFDKLSGKVAFIYGQNYEKEAIQKEMEKFPDSLKKYIKSSEGPDSYENYQTKKLFSNVIHIKPPKDQELLNTLAKQIEEDRKTVISQGNLSEMRNVLKKHGLLCMDLEQANFDDMTLTREKAEEVVGWATNHYISSCPVPCVKDDLLHLPHESLKLAILRLKEQEKETKKPSNNDFEYLASDDFEERLTSAVVKPDDISITFDDVGALEDVKKTLNELIILPMKRPELFSHGNLTRPCKGMLLFGPPGTGKTLIAKALAKEAEANFISVTPATLGSKWYGDTENLARAIFTYARKLAPAIIFMDEVDALLGARGGKEDQFIRLMRNEIMAGWDGLMSKEKERIIVIGTTNRPFDIDDAVIRRMPRRIYVGLPDVANRCKILKILLAKENLESGFCFQQLAEATEGYSGSDLKNLCVAAAYIPVQEILEKESKGEVNDGVPAIRALNVNDFIHSKTKVGASVAYNSRSIMELREWNEQYGEGGSMRKSTTI